MRKWTREYTILHNNEIISTNEFEPFAIELIQDETGCDLTEEQIEALIEGESFMGYTMIEEEEEEY